MHTLTGGVVVCCLPAMGVAGGWLRGAGCVIGATVRPMCVGECEGAETSLCQRRHPSFLYPMMTWVRDVIGFE